MSFNHVSIENLLLWRMLYGTDYYCDGDLKIVCSSLDYDHGYAIRFTNHAV